MVLQQLLCPLVLLIDNALKYSPRRSTIQISSQLSEGDLIVAVRNQGEPLSESERFRVFDKFYRGKDQRYRLQGTGMGLAIAKKNDYLVSDRALKDLVDFTVSQQHSDGTYVSWQPEKYRDEYRTALMEIIEQKAKHKEVLAKAPAPPPATNVVDLVKVLQESLTRSQSVRQKRGATRSSGRSTASLVRQKRRVGALS